jgi:hypothetical protein
MCVCVYNNMNDDESLSAAGSEGEESPLRFFDDILHNRIMQKKQEMHKTQNSADTDRV